MKKKQAIKMIKKFLWLLLYVVIDTSLLCLMIFVTGGSTIIDIIVDIVIIIICHILSNELEKIHKEKEERNKRWL